LAECEADRNFKSIHCYNAQVSSDLTAILAMKNRVTSQISTNPGEAPPDDLIANNISSAAMRPHINGESRNCKLTPQSTASHMQFAPILTLQYTSLIIATMLIVCLLSILLSGSLPQLPFSDTIATLDPTLKAFVYFFSSSALIYVAVLLRKPVRALEFNKSTGVFWIEKQRVFGWKVGESAQMPIAQVCALQLLSYPNPGMSVKTQFTAREHEVNVVFCNGERVNIINHRNGRAIRQDADSLAAFLEVPVWDKHRTEDETYLPASTVAAK